MCNSSGSSKGKGGGMSASQRASATVHGMHNESSLYYQTRVRQMGFDPETGKAAVEEKVKATPVATSPLSPESQLGQTPAANKTAGRLMQKRQATVTTPVLAGTGLRQSTELGGKPGLGTTLTSTSKGLSFEGAAKKSGSPSLALASKGHVSLSKSSAVDTGGSENKPDLSTLPADFKFMRRQLLDKGEFVKEGGKYSWNPDRGWGRVRDAIALEDNETRSMTLGQMSDVGAKKGLHDVGMRARQLSEGNTYYAGKEYKHDNTGQFLDKAAVVADVLGAGAGIFMGSPPIFSIVQGVRHYNQMKENQGDITALIANGSLPEKVKNSSTGRVLASLYKSRQRLAGRSQTQTASKGLGATTPTATAPAATATTTTTTTPKTKVLMRDRKRKTSGFEDYYVLVQQLLGKNRINMARGIYG